MKRKLFLMTLVAVFTLTSLVSYATFSDEYEVVDSVFMLPSETVDGGMDVNVSGRNVVNLLGEDGGCEDVDIFICKL